MNIHNLLVLSLSTAGVLGTFLLRPSLPDGHYSGNGTIDADGFAVFTYHGPISEDDIASISARSPSAKTEGSHMHRRDYGPFCSNHAAPSDIQNAERAFASYWDNQKFSGAWARTIVGTSMGYACNYGGEQIIHSGDYLNQMGIVDASCGARQAGWFSNYDNWRLNYGRDESTRNIC